MLPQAFQHRADDIKAIGKLAALGSRKIALVPAHLQPQLAFIAPADCDLQISFELSGRGALRPTFNDIHWDRASSPSELPDKLKLLRRRKSPRRARNVESQMVRFSKDVQVFVRLDWHEVIIAPIPNLVITSLAHYFVTSASKRRRRWSLGRPAFLCSGCRRRPWRRICLWRCLGRR